ncbi:MAG: sugar transferase [Elusimicrobiota bacterium]
MAISSDQYNLGIMTWKDSRKLVIRFFLLMSDLLAISIAYLSAYCIRFYYSPFIGNFPITKGFPPVLEYLQAAPIILFMWGVSIFFQGAYTRLNLAAIDEGIRTFKAVFFGTLLSMSAMFLYRDASFSRIVFVLGGILSFFTIYLFRQLLKITYISYIKAQRKPQRILVVGEGRLLNSIKKILDRHGDKAVLKMVDFNIEKILHTIIRSKIAEVLLAHPDVEHKEIVKLSNFCERKKVIFRLIPDILEIRMGEIIIDESLGLPTFQIKSISLAGSAFLTKRIMDVFIATLLIGACIVPFLMIAFLIKITSIGPIFYTHKRVGFRERLFDFLKFRTMVSNADDLLTDLKEKSDRKGPVFKMKNDPRITWIGTFLRRTSLDEIPQLLNVLRGEMSLVGPRPQVVWEAQNYDDWAKKRLNVLPGITGLWQVSGRAELTYEEMIELDVYYLEHWSPGLDIKVLLRTIPAVLFAKGAY